MTSGTDGEMRRQSRTILAPGAAQFFGDPQIIKERPVIPTNAIEKIHRASMRILETVGMVFHHEEALDICRKYGLKVDGKKVHFTENKIMELLSKVPESFELVPYNKERTVSVGAGKVNWGTAGGAPALMLPDGGLRPGLLTDFVDFLKMAHLAPSISFLNTLMIQASDVPLEHFPALNFFYASQISDKVLLALNGDQSTNHAVLAVAASLFGGGSEMARHPRFFGIVNTISPLQMDGNAVDSLIGWARAGQPSAVSPCTMAGSTGPSTLAGSIALSNAEALAGLALAQIINQGAPVIYGFQSTISDPRTASISVGAPEQAVFIEYGAALARFYRLPSRGGGLLTDADQVNLQCGYESMMNGLATRQAGYDLVLHGAGIMGAFAAVSFEKFVVDLEILGMLERASTDICLEDTDFALEIIDQLGTEGGYLTHKHTLKNCRRHWIPKISYRGPMGNPESRQLMDARISREKERMLEQYRSPDLPRTAVNDMKAALSKCGIEAKILGV